MSHPRRLHVCEYRCVTVSAFIQVLRSGPVENMKASSPSSMPRLAPDCAARCRAAHGTVRRERSGAGAGEGRLFDFAGNLRDPDNTHKQLRQMLAGTEWQGIHPHVFRHLVATRFDAAGLSAREIADYLGPEKGSMTQDVYMSRRVAGAAAGVALEAFVLGGIQ